MKPLVRWLALAVVLAVTSLVVGAHAQPAPELRVSVDANVVSLGDVLTLTMNVQSQDTPPSNPALGAIPGFQLVGSQVSPSQSLMIINGTVTQKAGLTATFRLQAIALGSHAIGPATVTIGSARYSAKPVVVRVVPVGQLPQRTQPAPGPPGFTPFDPWKGLFPGFDDDDMPPRPPEPTVATDPKFALSAPRGQAVFLHSLVDKQRAAVGEQVTLTVLLYIDTMAGPVEFTDAHEPSAPDFIKRALIEDDGAKPVGFADVGGHIWQVRLVRKTALFAIKAGELEIGPMRLALLRGRQSPSPRESERLHVLVNEPPVDGRPPGFSMGDAGHFRLSATVTPRVVEQHGAVQVEVEVAGTGNLPEVLSVPTRPGVEWLDPERRDKVGAQGERFGGHRNFSYVVRMQRPGEIDLGDIVLPFWDPEANRYAIARATLGTVSVKESTKAPSQVESSTEPLSGLPPPRTVREPAGTAAAHVSDRPFFWWSLGISPVAYAMLIGVQATGKRLRERLTMRAASPERALRELRKNAERACHGNVPGEAYAAIARAIESAAIVHLGLNVRGISLSELAAILDERGIDRVRARLWTETLRACDEGRFVPAGEGMEAPRRIWSEAAPLFSDKAKRS